MASSKQQHQNTISTELLDFSTNSSQSKSDNEFDAIIPVFEGKEKEIDVSKLRPKLDRNQSRDSIFVVIVNDEKHRKERCTNTILGLIFVFLAICIFLAIYLLLFQIWWK